MMPHHHHHLDQFLLDQTNLDSKWFHGSGLYEAPNWINHGGDLLNRRYAAKECKIGPETVSNLWLKWTFDAGRDITATPAIYDGTNPMAPLCGKRACRSTGLNATGFIANVTVPVARATPTIADDDLLIIGIYGPAVVIALEREMGKLVWMTQLDNNPAGVITMSGTFYKGGFYVGTSLLEEELSIDECCRFRGSLAKLDAQNGAILWQTFMLPDNNGNRGEYAGAAIWGSSPSIDIIRNQIHIATGNLYSTPERILQCQEEENNQTVPSQPDRCVEPDNHSDSILALDLDSGKIKWYRQLGAYDVWFFACNDLLTPNCPPGPNPDADFGEAPMMLSILVNGTWQDVVAAVQKSGFAWVLSREDGSLIWATPSIIARPSFSLYCGSTQMNKWTSDQLDRSFTNLAIFVKEAGPGGIAGGGTWGAATDEKRIYTNIVNNEGKNFTLVPSTKNITAGGWVAMDAWTGRILWSTGDPSNAATNGPVTVANGVLFAGSTYKTGPCHGERLPKDGKCVANFLDAQLPRKKHHEASNWINHGGELHNRRYAAKEYKISPETVSKLQLKWTFYAGKDITATPAIYDGLIYFPSWNGFIYAVKQCDGSLVWKQSLHELTGLNATGFVLNVTGPVSRSTPTIAGELLIIGLYGPAIVIALKRETGKLVWLTRLDNHTTAVITMSGTFDNRGFYVGTSSLEEGLGIGECCTFRGSFAKLNARTGAIVWQTFMLPDNNGSIGEYAGAAIWGSSPSIDIKRNQVYIATGNLYSAPERILKCQELENNQTVPTHPDQCVEPDNHSESMLALDLDSGEIEWYKQLGGYDVWFVACNNLFTPDCPPGPNPDADFGEAPMMLSSFINGTKRDLLAAVQKSGFAWVLDRDNGDIIWTTEAGPGSTEGGGIWGAATDERRIYTNIANGDHKNFTLKPTDINTTAGGWVAMDASTGKILWSTANPSNALASGPVTVASNVLFGGSMYKTGPVSMISRREEVAKLPTSTP
ncbi:Pyrrolo-quinoline quinone repeat [Dillenia turbinata]|uniref:Pyrrolo-quinoline quinone repeat n=1 Tax=Dillenia turbinata TaxID=194707 RepID=A0AAN8ZAG6_9MAGN